MDSRELISPGSAMNDDQETALLVESALASSTHPRIIVIKAPPRRIAAVETTEPVLMCAKCCRPTRHRFEKVKPVTVHEKLIHREHIFGCARCGTDRIWGLSE